MSSTDLPIFQAPKAEEPPSSLVVRYGHMGMIGEFPYDGQERPRCGQKVVIRGRRGTELADVLATTCSNTSCAVSMTREKLQAYIAESGGNDYPFSTEGRIVRIATPEDLEQQRRADAGKGEYIAACKELIRELDLPMKLVEVELLLGGEMATFYFLSEHRVDFRNLVKHLAAKFRTRIQMHQVGARDEARLVADYETCGQQCCCQKFLKVLRPVSMGSAKMQKATLDPSKISGRCGRLKCCLRYEEDTYEELRKKLPRNGTRVRTAEGIGVVEETMILTQLVKVRLDESDRVIAIANEELLERNVQEAAAPRQKPADAKPVSDATGAAEAGNNGDLPAKQAGGETAKVAVNNGEAAPRAAGAGGSRRSRPPRPASSAGSSPGKPREPGRPREQRGNRRGERPSQGASSRPSAAGSARPADRAPVRPTEAAPAAPNDPKLPPESDADAPVTGDSSTPTGQPPESPSGSDQPAPGMGALGRRRRRRRGREGR